MLTLRVVSDKRDKKKNLLKSMPGGIFLPVKDPRFFLARTTTDTNWFMSGLRGKPDPGHPEAFDLPLDDPSGRIYAFRKTTYTTARRMAMASSTQQSCPGTPPS